MFQIFSCLVDTLLKTYAQTDGLEFCHFYYKLQNPRSQSQLTWANIHPPSAVVSPHEMDRTVRRGSSLYPWETENPFICSAWKPDWRKWITGNMSVPAVIMLQRCYRTRPEGRGVGGGEENSDTSLVSLQVFSPLLSFSYCLPYSHTHRQCTMSACFKSVMTFTMCWRVNFTVACST